MPKKYWIIPRQKIGLFVSSMEVRGQVKWIRLICKGDAEPETYWPEEVEKINK